MVILVAAIATAFFGHLRSTPAIVATSTSVTPLICQGVTGLCADFYALPGATPLTSVLTAVANSQTASFSWNFKDGTTGTGNPVIHTFPQGEYLVNLTVTNGSSAFTVSHDVSEIGNLPAKPFVSPSSSSWNSAVSCQASVTTVTGIIGTVQNSYGGADLSGAMTMGTPMKHTLIKPCSMFGFSVFVELHSVSIISGPLTTTDCTTYPTVGSYCDVVGNLADGSGYMHQIRWEMERQWQASGELSQYSTPQVGQTLDVQGYMFWSFIAPVDAQHSFSGWYLELSAWRLSASPPPSLLSTSFTFSPSSPIANTVASFSGAATGGTPPYNLNWSFGDGGTGTGTTVTHNYTAAGSYSVNLTATDSTGQTASNLQSLIVQQAQPSTTLVFGYGSLMNASVVNGRVTGAVLQGPVTLPRWMILLGKISSVDGSGKLDIAPDPNNSQNPPGVQGALWSIPNNQLASLDASEPGYSRTTVNGWQTYVLSPPQNNVPPANAVYTSEVLAGAQALGLSATYIALLQNVLAGTASTVLSASFINSPSSVQTNQQVSFVAAAFGGNSPYTFSWSFGDGSQSTGQTATHIYTVAGSYTVTLTVTDKSSPQQTTTSQQTLTIASPPTSPPSPPPQVGTFTIHTSRSQFQIVQGSSASATITIASVNGFGGTLSFQATASSPQIITNLTPSSVILSSGGMASSDLGIVIGPSTSVGSYTVTVDATNGSLSQSSSISITVTSPPRVDFNATLVQSRLEFSQGSDGSTIVNVFGTGGYSGTVHLQVDKLPSGLSAYFDPSNVTITPGASANSELKISANSTLAPGTYIVLVTVQGPGNGSTEILHNDQATVQVDPANACSNCKPPFQTLTSSWLVWSTIGLGIFSFSSVVLAGRRRRRRMKGVQQLPVEF